MRAALDDLHYDAAQQALRKSYSFLPFPLPGELVGDLNRLPDGLRLCFQLFLLRETVSLHDAQDCLPTQFVDDLLALEVLETDDAGGLRSPRYALVSYEDRYLLVTGSRVARTGEQSRVYIGRESYFLARQLPYTASIGAALDMGTGSGFHAILMASTASRVVAVDVDPEAVETARLNAALNWVDQRVDVRCGSLFGPVEAERFDLVVANLPWLVIPAGIQFPAFAHGGEDGLRVLRPFLEELGDHLSSRGQALLFMQGLGDRHRPFVAAYLEDLARRAGFSVDLLLLDRRGYADLLRSWLTMLRQLHDLGTPALSQWQDLFERQGVERSYSFLIRVRSGPGSLRLVDLTPSRQSSARVIVPGVAPD